MKCKIEHHQKKANPKIFVIAGEDSRIQRKKLIAPILDMGLQGKIHKSRCIGDELEEEFKNIPYCSIIILGKGGISAEVSDYRRKNGFTHGSNIVFTYEQWVEHLYGQRPITAVHRCTRLYNAPTIFCKVNTNEITRCLEWAKQFLYKGEK